MLKRAQAPKTITLKEYLMGMPEGQPGVSFQQGVQTAPPGGDQEVAGAGLSGKDCKDDRELLHQDVQKGRPWLDSGLCTSANDGAHVTCLCGCCSKVDQCLWRLLWLTRLRAFSMLVEAVLFTAGTC